MTQREIKFRAWDITEGHEPEMHYFKIGQGFSGMDDCPIMQYTGLLDKNGKEIYEGNIVDIEKVGICRVDYLDHSMKFYFQSLEGYGKQFTAMPENIEIIGNIYENPELIDTKI